MITNTQYGQCLQYKAIVVKWNAREGKGAERMSIWSVPMLRDVIQFYHWYFHIICVVVLTFRYEKKKNTQRNRQCRTGCKNDWNGEPNLVSQPTPYQKKYQIQSRIMPQQSSAHIAEYPHRCNHTPQIFKKRCRQKIPQILIH